MDYTIHGILQARILEWVAFPFSRGSSQPRSPTLQADSLPAEPPGKPRNTGVGSLSLLQQIFPTQELNPFLLHLLHWQADSLPLSHKGIPRILEWVAYPFSRGSFQPRNRTGVSCIAGRLFTSWASDTFLSKVALIHSENSYYFTYLLRSFLMIQMANIFMFTWSQGLLI